MDIIKASGEKEKFSRSKLYRSLKRAGADSSLAERVSREVSKRVSAGVSSEKILNQTFSYLKKKNPTVATRYILRRAIMELGPTGFPFEKYVAEILKEYGYNTKVGQIVKGPCVNHEIDVTAEKGKEKVMIECKYHNRRGIRSDLKVSLYTYARFLDVKKSFNEVWLVTNTKCTKDAVRYGECAGLKIIGWNYPKGESLESLIEGKGLYPITALSSLKKEAKEKLIKNDIILIKDLLKHSADDLVRSTGLRLHVAIKLQKEAKRLI